MPPLFINQVKIANVRQDGTVIDDYGSRMKPENVDRLKMMMICQPADSTGAIALSIGIVNRRGKILADKKSIKDHPVSLPVCVADSSGVGYEIGLWSPKRLDKGCRLEISAGGEKLCSTEIPLRGQIMYQPITIQELGSGEEYSTSISRSGNSLPARATRDYHQPRASTIFQVGGRTYQMTKWVEVEM